MKIWLAGARFCFFVSLLLAISCASQVDHKRSQSARRSKSYKACLTQRVAAAQAALAPDARLGISVVALNDNHKILAVSEDATFVPASVAKLFTAAASLDILGPAYRFTTDVCVDGPSLKLPKIAHDIYLRGGGDPSLIAADIAALARVTADMGVSQVAGDIVIDDSDFDSTPYGAGWMVDDLTEGFSAPVSAVSVAANAITVTVVPGLYQGDALRVIVDPPNSRYTQVVVQGRTSAPGVAATLRWSMGLAPYRSAPVRAAKEGPSQGPQEPQFSALEPNQSLVVSGTLPPDGLPRSRTFAISDPAVWSGRLFATALGEAGVKTTGRIRRGQVPTGCLPVARHASAPLGTLLPVWMKSSDNHAMESLFKRLAQVTSQTPATFASGAHEVRRVLQQRLGLKLNNYRVVDGSGLSRYNLVSPETLTAVLRTAAQDFFLAPEFISSLPIGGTDGTLGRRLRDPRLLGAVRAKTGSMTGVSSLAGLIHTHDNETLAFAIMADSTLTSADRLRALQDAVVLLLIDSDTVMLGIAP